MAIAVDVANAGTAVDDSSAASLGCWSASASPLLSSVSGGGLTWAIAAQGKHPSAQPHFAIAYAQAPSGLASGTTITANWSTSVAGRQIGISSFTGVATSSPVDVVGSVSNTGNATWTSGTLAIAAGSMIVISDHVDGVVTSTATAPAQEALDWTDGANTSHQMSYRIEAAGGSVAATGTWSSSVVHASIAVAFLEGAGGGGGPVGRMRSRPMLLT
jgi:hypothetical protein